MQSLSERSFLKVALRTLFSLERKLEEHEINQGMFPVLQNVIRKHTLMLVSLRNKGSC